MTEPIDNYLSALPHAQRIHLSHVRSLIRSIVPDASESISYGMPAFKYKSKYLIGYAAFKDHLSIFPGPESIRLHEAELTEYKTSKGTVQFTDSHPLQDTLLKDIVLSRIKEIDGS